MRKTPDRVVLNCEANFIRSAIKLDLVDQVRLIVVVRGLKGLDQEFVEGRLHSRSYSVLSSGTLYFARLILLLHNVVASNHVQVRVEVTNLRFTSVEGLETDLEPEALHRIV